MALLSLLLPAALLGLWFLSTKIMQTTLTVLADPRDKIAPRAHIPSIPELREALRDVETWAAAHGFREDVMFDFHVIMAADQPLFCQTWKNASERTYLVFYHGLGKHFEELVTIYDDKTGVTTTNAPDAHSLPAAPGAFIQAFPGHDLDRLETLHHSGRRTLERRTGLAPQDRPEITLDLIVMSLQRQAKYVMSVPGWKWKGAWWLTARKRWMIGKDVGWQLDRFGVHEPASETRS